MPDIQIRDGKPDDLPLIEQISDTELGVGYFNTIKNQLFLSDHLIRVILYNKRIVGFCYAYITNYKEIKDNWKNSQTKPHLNSTFGVLQTIAVKDGFKKKGMGNTLINDAVDCLIKHKASVIYTSLWDKPDMASNSRLMTKNGFEWQKTIPDYWTSDSIKNGYKCPVCGHPCRCSASIYLKTI